MLSSVNNFFFYKFNEFSYYKSLNKRRQHECTTEFSTHQKKNLYKHKRVKKIAAEKNK